MDRKDFFLRLFQAGAGVCCCGSLLGQGMQNHPEGLPEESQFSDSTDWIKDLEKRMKDGSQSPAWRKAEFAELWIKRLMDNMDELLTVEERKKLMQACGRSCYIHAFGVASKESPSPDALDNFLLANQRAGETETRREGNTVYFQFGSTEQNAYGLRLLDGYCMCPLVESGPENLSPTYCQCSTGYVKEMFERLAGKPVEVEILESLRMGGKLCRFRIVIPDME